MMLQPSECGVGLGHALSAVLPRHLTLKSVVMRTIVRAFPPPYKSEESLVKKRARRSLCLAHFAELQFEWVGLFIAGSFAAFFAEPRQLHSYRDVNLVMWRRAAEPRSLRFLWDLARRPRFRRQNRYLEGDDGQGLQSLRFGDLHVQVYGSRQDEGIYNHRDAVDHWYMQQGEPHHLLAWTLHQVDGRLLSRYHFPNSPTALPAGNTIATRQDGNQTAAGRSPAPLRQQCLRSLEEDRYGATVAMWGRVGTALLDEERHKSYPGYERTRVIEIKLGHD